MLIKLQKFFKIADYCQDCFCKQTVLVVEALLNEYLDCLKPVSGVKGNKK